MKNLIGPAATSSASPCILVVDDDRRVVDLLNIALAAHGYRVITACDGDEAVRVALSRRPDLVVLDVRLPKKSGLEVCELLRQDPDDPYLPIIMVSAASETEARLQGFARGADDYLAKPFSPKELIARIKRLLVRSSEARESRKRGNEAELELARTRDDVKRAHAELRREQYLRELTAAAARDLHGALDIDELAARFLLTARTQVGVSVAALLTFEHLGGAFVPAAIRGDGLERMTGIEVAPEGELATLLSGMGRPVRLAELERFPEMREELRPFVSAGLSLVAPLRGPEGLEGLLVADERLDGEDASRLDVDVLTLLCEAAAVGLANARRCRALAEGLIETLIARAGEEGADDDSEARVEAAALADRAGRTLSIPPRMRGLIAHGVALGAWAASAPGRHALALAAAADPTRRLLDLARLIDRGAGPEDDEDGVAHEREAVMLMRVARDYAAARRQGCDGPRALAQAIEAAGTELEDGTRQALIAAAREVVELGAGGR